MTEPGPIGVRWRSLTNAEREREYSPSSCLPDGDYRPFIDEYRRRSHDAWTRLAASTTATITTLAYGRARSQTIDVAVPASATVGSPPLLVFIHGGYWQELSKVESRFAADACLQRGWAFAAVDYSLAPQVDVSTIVGECRAAVRSLYGNASALGVDPDRIVMTGSSAGAHLAAMVALDRGPGSGPGLGAGVGAAVLVSGIYELEPLIGTSINEALGLDTTAAARNSPIRAELAGFPSAVIAYGADETSEFKAQSTSFAAALDRAGTSATVIEVPGRNHFDVILDLAEPHTLLGDATAELVDGTASPDGQRRP